MYIPKKYQIDDWETQKSLIQSYPLATVITIKDELMANHFPLIVVERDGEIYLQAHLAKANPQVKQLASGEKCLVIFKSDDSYIDPAYYATKKQTQKVVPTWDFAAIHVYGIPKIIEDSGWIRNQLEALTELKEGHKEKPWKVSDAPEKYTSLLQKIIVGLEIRVMSLESKFKFEQGMPTQDIEGVIKGLEGDGKKIASDHVKKANFGAM